MEIKQLQSLLAIADHGSFSAAARVLDTVQSNVSWARCWLTGTAAC
ncbi:MAG: Bacterial regulatory helix-turn-helix protein lysR family [Actinomycetota bacterium]